MIARDGRLAKTFHDFDRIKAYYTRSLILFFFVFVFFVRLFSLSVCSPSLGAAEHLRADLGDWDRHLREALLGQAECESEGEVYLCRGEPRLRSVEQTKVTGKGEGGEGGCEEDEMMDRLSCFFGRVLMVLWIGARVAGRWGKEGFNKGIWGS